MKWFKPASVYIEKEEKNTAQQIKDLAKTYADSMCPNYINGWNEKDKALFFAQRELIRAKKERDELKAVVNGERGYSGHFQEQFTK